MPSLMGLTQSAFDPASRVRFIQYIPALREAGWRVVHRPNRPDRQWRSPLRHRFPRALHYQAGRLAMRLNRLRDIRDAVAFDAVFVNRDLAGGHPFFERRLLRKNPRVVFDFDDAIYLSPRNEARVGWMCARASWVTPGNEYLAEFARRFTDRVTVVPTVVDTERYEARRWNGEIPAPVRVGWSGSDQSIAFTLFPYLELLADAQRMLDFELVIVSNTRPVLPVAGLRWRFLPWSAETEGRLGQAFDIGIMPLVDDAFQRGKCGLKLLQYMALGLPTVASPVGVNREITLDGRTGILASTPEEWIEALRALVCSPELRASMGVLARRHCEATYSLRRWAPTLFAILDGTARRGGGP